MADDTAGVVGAQRSVVWAEPTFERPCERVRQRLKLAGPGPTANFCRTQIAVGRGQQERLVVNSVYRSKVDAHRLVQSWVETQWATQGKRKRRPISTLRLAIPADVLSVGDNFL